MIDGIRIDRSTSWLLVALAAGLASASLWLSVFLAPFFLLPLQSAFGRLGKRGGLVSAVAAAVVLAPALLWRLFVDGQGVQPMDIAIVLAFPMASIIAVYLLNSSLLGRIDPSYRVLGIGLAIGLLSAPALAAFLSDAQLKAGLVKSVGQLMDRFTSALPKGAAAQASGYDAAALLASFDPQAMVEMSLKIFASSYAALVCLLLGGSYWLGNRLSGEGSVGRSLALPLSELRAPQSLVWPFLSALGLLFLVLFFKAGSLAQAAAWNLVLAMSLVYAAQGMGIVSHFLKRMRVPGGFRIAFAALVFVSALGSPVGAALLAILPLLGVTELWIPYRNLKGVGA